jgi:nucleoside-diphosphate-sugar epimerase
LKEEKEVRALKREASDIENVKRTFGYYSDDPENLLSRIEWINADITDQFEMNNAIRGMEFVYHLAARVSFSPAEKHTILKNNIGGTENIVNACLEHNIRKLCFVSSVATLGNTITGEKITEEMLWTGPANQSYYSISKYKSEMSVWRGINEGLNAIIVNPSIIIGPGNWHRSSGQLIQQVWTGLKYYSEGITGYVDVKDVIKSMILLMNGQFSGERFVITSENLSYKEILEMIAGALGKPSPSRIPSPFMIRSACYLDWLKSKLTGNKRLITREIISAANEKKYYSNEKIVQATGITFIPVNNSIQETVRLFIKDMSG